MLPPEVGPTAGNTLLTTGGKYAMLRLLDTCPDTVITTGMLSPDPAGSTHCTPLCEYVPDTIGQGRPPTVMVPDVPNDVPASCNTCPPAVPPSEGDTDCNVGPV